MNFWKKAGVSAMAMALAGGAVQASSHREAPGIAKTPKVDGTDFYMFRSYESGRSGFVTLLANYLPLQDVYGGPNFFELDPDALYEIHVDNDGDAREDLTFQFRFTNTRKDISLGIGGQIVAVPLVNVGRIGPIRRTPPRSTSSRAIRRRDSRRSPLRPPPADHQCRNRRAIVPEAGRSDR
jgi:hypothetical protein